MYSAISIFLFFTSFSITGSSGYSVSAKQPFLSTVHQFPTNGTWIENLAVRTNGHILITRTDVPELWTIDPFTKTASLIHSFSDATALTGITEVYDDTFAIVALNSSLATFSSTPGTGAIWKVNMKSRKPVISLVQRMPDSIFPNGLTTLNSKAGDILIADSGKGVVFKMNTNTGAYSIALTDPNTMLPASNGPIPIGINGVKLFKGHVYYTSTTRQLFCRVPVSALGEATGPYEVLASGFYQDDFTLSEDGVAYISGNANDEVLKVGLDGTVSVAAGNPESLDVAGATSCAFAKGGDNKGILYVATGGALGAPINGTIVEPGKIVTLRVDDD
jgi:hypothetical protein